MSTTITISGSIGWAQSFVGFKGLALGVSSEPAISTANIILQTIIGPPFTWNWNRSSATFTTTAGIQDYSQATAGFGFIEKGSYKIPLATITNTVATGGVATYTAANNFQIGDLVTVTGTTNGSGVFNIKNQTITSATSAQFTVNMNASVSTSADTGTATVGVTTEISEIENILGTGTELGSPVKIAPQRDDNAGNITYRVLPIPDRVYQVEVIYQQRPTSLITSLSQTWAPIPDHYSYIYQWGFLALIYAYNSDSRWAQASQKFVAGLLGAAEGLEDTEQNIFQHAWLNMITEQQARSAETQQGVGTRQQL